MPSKIMTANLTALRMAAGFQHAARLAGEMDVSANWVTMMERGERTMTPTRSKQLEAVLDATPENNLYHWFKLGVESVDIDEEVSNVMAMIATLMRDRKISEDEAIKQWLAYISEKEAA